MEELNMRKVGKGSWARAATALLFFHWLFASLSSPAAEPATTAAASTAKPTSGTPPEDENVIPAPKLPDPEGAKKLPEPDQVWVDAKRHQVLVDGYVSLREGYLEMFACLEGTKEHESVLAARTKAKTVHAALLVIGAVPGTPVQFRPKFRPPTGTEIDLEVRWLDDEGKWMSAKAQDWVREAKSKKPMKQPWVFAGSTFSKDPTSGREFYMAEGGDFICVSNFTSAMLDVPMESSDSNEGLLFEANPEKIPILGTPVRLVLTPKLEKRKGVNAGSEAKTASDKPAK
jgi:hypothetical protein